MTKHLKLPTIFGDHMVLQQGVPLKIWGHATPGETVQISFGEQLQHTKVTVDGRWELSLDPESADVQGRVFRVTAGDQSIEYVDVVVGDVWLASGQSNMEFGLQTDADASQAISAATDARIRMFFVPWKTSLSPGEDLAPAVSELDGRWVLCSPWAMAATWGWHGFSAAAYYFAEYLIKRTNAPIGMIGAYKGGTRAEAWTSFEGLSKFPPFSTYLSSHRANIEETSECGEPTAPTDKQYNRPTGLFNGMIAPLTSYALRGVLWYQGESNSDRLVGALEYADLFPRLIEDWREQWKRKTLPFLYVQLANFRKPASLPCEGIWAWTRDAQRRALQLPHTGMAVAVDLGDADDIHPPRKAEVGRRLAMAARHLVYGDGASFSGPDYKSMRIEGNVIRISFAHVGEGLTAGRHGNQRNASIDETVGGFAIADATQQFWWANARIEDDTVVVWSELVDRPVAVRYNWADNPQGNLYNREGLPASPFRTDDWSPPSDGAAAGELTN